jgi:hypothetical protein
MAIKRWNPSQLVTRQEKFILGRLKGTESSTPSFDSTVTSCSTRLS